LLFLGSLGYNGRVMKIKREDDPKRQAAFVSWQNAFKNQGVIT
jgi:hypothetical protein